MTMLRRPIEFAGGIDRARIRAAVRAVVFVLACTTGISASGRDSAVRDLGDWTLAASKDGKGCFLSREYAHDGGTTLLLGLDTDGTNRLSVLNANWSIKAKDRLKLNFRLSNSSFPAHFAVGIVSDGKQGFVTSFGAKFPADLAASRTLLITRGEVTVERLSLDGGEAAVAGLKTCVDEQRTKPAAVEGAKAQSDDIPRDPFASAPARRSKR